MGNVYISPNVKKVSERIDTSGNVIDPGTKQVIKRNIPDEVEPTPIVVEAPVQSPVVSSTPTSIQDEIAQAEARVEQLKQLKKQKIEEMKKQLAALES